MNGRDRHAVAASTIFDGSSSLHGWAVVIERGKIAGLASRGQLGESIPVHVLREGAWLAPGFIDCQVNGGGDVLFNDLTTLDGLRAIARAHRKFGTTSFLPTLISDTREKMRAALDAVDEAGRLMPSIAGIHIEGPFISPEKPGVHNPALIRKAAPEDLELLTQRRTGVTAVTLAPECAPDGFVASLVRAGIRVSLGHSMASYDETKAALAEGLTGFTHLFNAMRMPLPRDPGPVPAALETAAASFGMIVDGIHVHPAMLRLAINGAASPMLVTDAMPPVGGCENTFTLYGNEIAVKNGRCARADGTLAGAALDMAAAVRNCVNMLKVPLTTALRFATIAPARFLGLDAPLGRLAPGYRADMVAFDPETLTIYDTWVCGEPEAEPEPLAVP
jgi:N-acetylglucosamine-6-phosphate deacetylase